jgi:hypothetical protein
LCKPQAKGQVNRSSLEAPVLMGMFDSWLPDFMLAEDKRIGKHQRRVTDGDCQPDDREASVMWLADHGTPKALLALLSRFDMKLSQSLKDQSEKEYAFQRLLEHGDDLERPLRAWLKRCHNIAHPLRMMEELRGREEAVQVVFGLLERELNKDDFKATRKNELLVWLAETKHEECIPRVAPFLKDFDEGVRLAAAEVLIFQHDVAALEPMADAIADQKEDSQRLRIRILDVFVARQWSVGEREIPVPDGYRVTNGRVAKL